MDPTAPRPAIADALYDPGVVRFVHTADWQLGKAPHYLAVEARARFSAARLDVISTIGELAVQEHCGFVVVCGDVFESNHIDRQMLVRALEKMRASPQISFYLLPGNHDPLNASSIFQSPTFKDHRPGNVTVLDATDLVEAAPGVELVAAPWRNKRPLTDLVDDACQGLEPTDAVRIAVGHGALDAMWPGANNPAHISLQRLEEGIESGLIHYVALGDRHSTTATGRTGRVWYSGAPEPTDFDEEDPGNVLVVELDRERVHVDSRQVGIWQFERRHWELGTGADLDALEDWLTGLTDKERTIVRVDLTGQVSVAQKVRLDKMLEHHTDLLGSLDIRNGQDPLAVIPDDADRDDFGLSGFALEALAELFEMAESGDQTITARDALALLYRLVGAGE